MVHLEGVHLLRWKFYACIEFLLRFVYILLPIQNFQVLITFTNLRRAYLGIVRNKASARHLLKHIHNDHLPSCSGSVRSHAEVTPSHLMAAYIVCPQRSVTKDTIYLHNDTETLH
jgi:hypothetical protein